MWNIGRLFFALWYLGGSVFHIILGTRNPEGYRPFGQTALIPQFREIWSAHMMPRMTMFALLLAAFELIVGILILGKGKFAKSGLAASIVFNLFLVQLGLAMPQTDWRADLWNRLPTAVFAVLQFPLLFVKFDKSFPAVVRSMLSRS